MAIGARSQALAHGDAYVAAMIRTCTLLIVDDNARVRATIRSIVGTLADQIDESADGLDAVERYSEMRPDWVLMDIEMPGLDGISAARRIRQLDPAARIVIVTGYDDPTLRQSAADAGVVAYVLKDNLLELLHVLTPAIAD